jgi:hypothetical protein
MRHSLALMGEMIPTDGSLVWPLEVRRTPALAPRRAQWPEDRWHNQGVRQRQVWALYEPPYLHRHPKGALRYAPNRARP